MEFEWDDLKDKANSAKHGISFEDAKRIWDDPERITGPGQVVGFEPRWLSVGKVDGKVITVCWTQRQEKIRIISARPARPEEREVYGEEKST
jgi:uncharacterized DUF497 family protein